MLPHVEMTAALLLEITSNDENKTTPGYCGIADFHPTAGSVRRSRQHLYTNRCRSLAHAPLKCGPQGD